MKTTAARSDKPSSVATRSIVVDTLEVMKYGNSSSYLKVKEELSRYFQGKDGFNGKFIETNEYAEPEMPNKQAIKDTYGLNEVQSVATFNLRVAEHMKTVTIWKHRRAEMYGIIMSILSDIGREKVMTHPDYAAATAVMGPLELWRIVVATHSTESGHMSLSEAKQVNKQYYATLKKDQTETLHEFK